MKTFMRVALSLMAIVIACQAGNVLAEEYYFISEGEKAPTPSGDKVGDPGCCPTTTCGGQDCGACEACCAKLGCIDTCSCWGVTGFAGLDSFKGVADGDHPGNFGAVSGLNIGTLLPGENEYGIGWQTGMSYGVYDFDGAVRTVDPARSQQQTFITLGLFRKAKADERISGGLVYDWMLNDQWGQYGVPASLGQWRGQIEYALNGCNAVGMWGTVRDLNSTNQYSGTPTGPVFNRSLNQFSVFWHHKFCWGADSTLWIGVPERDRQLNRAVQGSLIDWTFGANVQVPLSERMALYANGAYFHPSASAGTAAAVESGYNIGMGIVWYFGASKAKTHAINGNCAVPYMPVANNSNFLVDQRFGP